MKNNLILSAPVSPCINYQGTQFNKIKLKIVAGQYSHSHATVSPWVTVQFILHKEEHEMI